MTESETLHVIHTKTCPRCTEAMGYEIVYQGEDGTTVGIWSCEKCPKEKI